MNRLMRIPYLCSGWLLAGLLAGPAPAQSPEVPNAPAPGEEVMRPTQRGLRLTPAIARGISRVWMQDKLWQDMDLTDEQQQKIAEASARRMMNIAHRNAGEGARGIEYLIEATISTNGQLNAEISRELGDKLQPLARSGREFLDGIADDARPVLNEEQMKRLEAQIESQKRMLDRFDRKLQDWREGRFQEGDNPFDEFDKEENIEGQPKTDPRLRNARRQAEWELQRISTWEWNRFLDGAAAMFKFDESQKARGEALLKEYEAKAKAIQTPEWKARVERNRMLKNLQWQLGDVPRAPWRHRLDKEYKEATRPLMEMTDRFYGEVLALATPQQQAEALEEVRRTAEQHGLAVAEIDLRLLQAMVQPPPAPAAGG